MRSFGIKIVFIIFFLFLVVNIAFCEKKHTSNTSNTEPVKIVSKEVIYDHNKKIIRFLKDVHLIKGTLEVWCDSLIVFIKKDQKFNNKTETTSKKDYVDKVIAEKNVRINMEDKYGRCKKATYFADKDLLMLQGDAVLTQGKNKVMGETINIYRSLNKTEVIGGKKQVEVLLYPKETKKRKKQ